MTSDKDKRKKLYHRMEIYNEYDFSNEKEIYVALQKISDEKDIYAALKKLLDKTYVHLRENGDRDPESSHMLESAVKNHVIKAIAKGELLKSEMVNLCQVLEKITELPFTRWFA